MDDRCRKNLAGCLNLSTYLALNMKLVSLVLQIELQIMARLSHPNIVRVYGGCLTPPNLFVVAELMEGDLSDRIHNLVAAEGATDEGVQGTGTGMLPREALTAALDIIRGLVRYRSLVRYRGRVRYSGTGVWRGTGAG